MTVRRVETVKHAKYQVILNFFVKLNTHNIVYENNIYGIYGKYMRCHYKYYHKPELVLAPVLQNVKKANFSILGGIYTIRVSVVINNSKLISRQMAE